MEETLLKKTAIFDLVEKKDDCGIGFNPIGINAPNWITIVVEKNGKFLLVKQLRYGLMCNCEEFVSGQVDAGENALETARRELQEETGYLVSLDDIIYLGSFAANPAFMNNSMYYFYVNLDNVEYTISEQRLDDHEKLEVLWKDKADYVAYCRKNKVSIFMAGAFWLLSQNNIF